MRCPECGHNNPDNQGRCSICHTVLVAPTTARQWPAGALANTQAHPLETGGTGATRLTPWTAAPPTYQNLNRPYAQAAPRATGARFATEAAGSRRGADVAGRIIAVEAPTLERPDFDVCRALTKTLWLLLLVVSPLIFLHAVLVTLGALPAVLAVVGLLFLVRFLSPTNLFTLYHLLALVNPLGRRNETEQVPVRYLRVRGEDGESEYVVRIKGNLTLSNLMPDDLVSFWGRWRQGVLHARYAYSHRTQAWVELQRSYSWLTLTATVCVVLGLIAYFYGPITQLFVRAQEWGITQ